MVPLCGPHAHPLSEIAIWNTSSSQVFLCPTNISLRQHQDGQAGLAPQRSLEVEPEGAQLTQEMAGQTASHMCLEQPSTASSLSHRRAGSSWSMYLIMWAQQWAFWRQSCREGALWEDSKYPGNLRTWVPRRGLPTAMWGMHRRQWAAWGLGARAPEEEGAGRWMVLRGLSFAALRSGVLPGFPPPRISPKQVLVRRREAGCLPTGHPSCWSGPGCGLTGGWGYRQVGPAPHSYGWGLQVLGDITVGHQGRGTRCWLTRRSVKPLVSRRRATIGWGASQGGLVLGRGGRSLKQRCPNGPTGLCRLQESWKAPFSSFWSSHCAQSSVSARAAEGPGPQGMGGSALWDAVVVSMGGVCPLGAERVGRGHSSCRGRGGSHPEGCSHTTLSCCVGICGRPCALWAWARVPAWAQLRACAAAPVGPSASFPVSCGAQRVNAIRTPLSATRGTWLWLLGRGESPASRVGGWWRGFPQRNKGPMAVLPWAEPCPAVAFLSVPISTEMG